MTYGFFVAPANAGVEAAVLIEAGWQALVDEVWVVTASRERAIERVVATRGLSRAEVERRLDNQISDEERVAGAACAVRNDGTFGELRSALERCWRERLNLPMIPSWKRPALSPPVAAWAQR